MLEGRPEGLRVEQLLGRVWLRRGLKKKAEERVFVAGSYSA